MKAKLIVLGGGAAGLMASCAAARVLEEPGAVLVLEGNEKRGRKLLATGNGRCNLTNLHAAPEHFLGDSKALPPLLFAYTPARIRSIFDAMGLETVADGEGRVYPRSMQAASVLAALVREAEQCGVVFQTGKNVVSAVRTETGFRFVCADGSAFTSRACVLAAGGAASPKLSLGEGGYALARSLGHSVTALYPALTSVLCEKSRRTLRPLSGVRVSASVSLYAGETLLAASDPGEKSEVLFSENGVSGISVFDLTAKAYRVLAGTGGCTLRLDLLPDHTESQIAAYLRRVREEYGTSPAGDLLLGLLPMQIGWALVREAGADPNAAAASLPEDRLLKIARLAKRWEFPVTGTRGFENAQITAGGVPMREVDPMTMRSRITPDLYLAGELLDVHGCCGGYNLHFAWASGHAAGTAAARALLEERL